MGFSTYDGFWETGSTLPYLSDVGNLNRVMQYIEDNEQPEQWRNETPFMDSNAQHIAFTRKPMSGVTLAELYQSLDCLNRIRSAGYAHASMHPSHPVSPKSIAERDTGNCLRTLKKELDLTQV